MKPASPPSSNPAESQWVQGELVRSLFRTARNTQWITLLLVPVFVGILWDNSPLGVALWTSMAAAISVWRFAVLRQYMNRVRHAGSIAHLAFFRQHQWIWPASALVWGSTTLLFFDRSPLTDQFLCWLILAGLGMFAVNSLSSHFQTLRRYLDLLAVTALGVMMWHSAVDLKFGGPSYHYWLMLLLAIFWFTLRQAGLRLHVTHRRNYELQYRNNQLIESLTRQTQAALDAVEIKNRFLASAAHDIRQPVHALGLYADWLGSEPELVNEIAPKIVESTKAVNALFDSLFDLARLDSGKVRLNIEEVDLGRLLHDLELQYRPLAATKGLEFRMRHAEGRVMSDPILLRRIVGNLVSNAIKYTQKGGVLLAVRQREPGLVIEVYDTGVGIAQVHQREVFREFFKVPTHAGTEEGFGLGLYIVARLSAILGHPISLRSRIGRGTVFRVLLRPTDPRAATDRAQAAVAQLVSIP